MIRSCTVFLVVIFSSLVFTPSHVFAREREIVKMNIDVEIPRGAIEKDVVAIGGNVIVYGEVDGDIVAVGGSVFLKERSVVNGDIVVIGGNLIREDGSEARGRVTHLYIPRFIPVFKDILRGGWITFWATVSLLTFVGFLGLAVLFTALIPEHIGTMVNTLEKSFLMSTLWGVVWLIMIAPIAILLAISVVGVILIPLQILLTGLALILGYITSAVFIGKNLLLYSKRFSPPYADAALGIIVLFLIGMVPLAGPILKSVFLVAGFGAVVTTRFGTVK